MNTDVHRKLKEGNQKKENVLSLLKVLVLLEIYPRFFLFRVCTFVGLDPDPFPNLFKLGFTTEYRYVLNRAS